MSLATELSRLLLATKLAKDAAQAHKLLTELTGKLIVHLAAEDQVLYPQLLKAKNPRTQTMAKRFITEMGSIAQAFKSYVVKWGSPASIQANPEAFVTETKGIISALGERIRKENTQLYPLADQR